jgi:hypothetical protein
MEEAGAVRKPMVVLPEQGRAYAMGRMRGESRFGLAKPAGCD